MESRATVHTPRVRRVDSTGAATSLGLLSLVCVLAVGCGSTHPSPSAVAACVGATGDRADAGVIEQAYRDGKLGSAAAVRSEIAALGPLPGSGTESFVRKDGTIVRWQDMDDAQQRTFSTWSHRSNEATGEIGTEAFRAAQRAVAGAPLSSLPRW
jgi:hypothetical protein